MVGLVMGELYHKKLHESYFEMRRVQAAELAAHAVNQAATAACRAAARELPQPRMPALKRKQERHHKHTDCQHQDLQQHAGAGVIDEAIVARRQDQRIHRRGDRGGEGR